MSFLRASISSDNLLHGFRTDYGVAGYCEPEETENLVGLILSEGFRTNSETMAGVERLAVMMPDSSFLEGPKDDLTFPGYSLELICNDGIFF